MPHIHELQSHKLLLDTRIWIWLLSGTPRFTPSFHTALDTAKGSDRLLISAISLWEIGMLIDKKRIEIGMDFVDFVDKILSFPGVNCSPINAEVALESTRLPGSVHGDPADRFLVATAHVGGAVLVTHDQKLLNYGRDRYLSVYDPCTIS
jgi:PIN domain nuclease of toxin-antitoxin system